MSGPKEGDYRNIRAECENLKNTIEEELRNLENLEKSLVNYNFSSAELDFARRFANTDLLELKNTTLLKIRDLLAPIRNLTQKTKSIQSYSDSSLASLREYLKNVRDLGGKVRKIIDDFRDRVYQVLRNSATEAENLRKRLLNEISEFLKSEEFREIEEWAGAEEDINNLRNTIETAKFASLSKVELLHSEFFDKVENLKERAFRNKHNFLTKKDTSSNIIKILEELNYVSIERKLETDKFGNIVVLAESPSSNWNLTFNIGNDGELKVITPYDDRCYNELENIRESLSKVGIEIRIKQLEEAKAKHKVKTSATKSLSERSKIKE